MSAADRCKLNTYSSSGGIGIVGKRLAALTALLSLLLALPDTTAQTRPTQFDVEAAYLLNFGKFVNWPQNSAQPGAFTICVFGDDPFGPMLERTIAGEKLEGHPVTGKRIEDPQEASGCSILYIHASEATRVARVLAQVQGRPVLTVSDMPNFLDHGGIIQFVMVGDRVRFEVNLQPTNQDGLMLSSELLKVAVKVRGAKTGQ